MVVLRAASVDGKEEKQRWIEKQSRLSRRLPWTQQALKQTEELAVTCLCPSGLYSIFILSHDFPALFFMSMYGSNSLNRFLSVLGFCLFVFALVCSSC